MALSGSLTTNAYGGVRSLTLTWSATQSIEGNTSTINWTLSGSGSTANYNPYYMTGPTKVLIDGAQVHYSTSRIQLRSGTVVASGSHTVTHNQEGNKSISIRVEGAIYTTSVNCTAEQTFQLDTIPRRATMLDATSFTDEDASGPTIYFSNPTGATLTAFIDAGQAIRVGVRQVATSPYTYTLSEHERDQLRQLSNTYNSKLVSLVLEGTVPGTSEKYLTWVDRTLTIQNAAPTLAPTVVDSNSTTVALTGDSSKMVRYHSDAKVTFGASAVKHATIQRKQVTCGSKSLTTDGTMQDVESGNFAFSVTDSRGNTVTKTVTKTLVNYTKLTCNLGDGIPDATGKFVFRVSGNFFNASFGAVANTLTVQYRYRVVGGTYSTYKAMTVSKSGNSYTASVTITGLDYTKPYQFQAQAVDKLATVTTEEKTVKSIPVFDYSKDSFNVNGTFTIHGTNILDLVYPVGSIYMSVNSTNPKTLFGGTWVQLQDRFLLGAGTSYKNGTTGGEATHALSQSEMPTHNHGTYPVGGKFVSTGSTGEGANISTGGGGYVMNLSTANAGGGSPHNNMPPYLVVYMWKRTA